MRQRLAAQARRNSGRELESLEIWMVGDMEWRLEGKKGRNDEEEERQSSTAAVRWKWNHWKFERMDGVSWRDLHHPLIFQLECYG